MVVMRIVQVNSVPSNVEIHEIKLLVVALSTGSLAGAEVCSESLLSVEGHGQCFQCALCTWGFDCTGAVSLSQIFFFTCALCHGGPPSLQIISQAIFICCWVTLGEDKCKSVCPSLPSA